MSAMTDYGKLMDQSAAAPDAARTRQALISQIPTDQPPVVEPAELYGGLMDADGEQAKARMNVVLDVALKHQPDTAASDKSLAATMGLPIEVVERNRDEIQRIAKIKQVQALTTASPVLARQLGDPEFAKLAHDDVESLSAIEGTLRFGKNSGSAMVGGLYGASAGVVGVAQAGFDAASPFLEPLVGRILPGNPLRATAQGLDAYRQQIEATSKGWMPQGSGNIESGWYSGLASLSRNLAGLPLAFAPGGQAAALTAMTAPVFGQEFGAARDRGLPVANALTYGASQAAIEYATEKLPLSRLVGDVKAGETFLKTLGRQALLEVPNEQAATILQDLNEWAVLNPDKPFADYLAERPDAAVQTLVATLVGVGGQTSVVKGVDYALNAVGRQERKAQEGESGAQLLEQINKLAAADKLLARDPETFERFVEQAATESDVSHVYVDAEVLNQDGMGLKLAEVSPSVAAQLQTAIETGGSVSIPVQEYTSKIAPTEYASALLEHLRTEEDGMSRAEAKSFMETAEQQFQESLSAQQALAAEDSAFRASADVVRQTVREQLDAVSRFTPQVNDAYTSMVGNYYAVQAARIGVTPQEMYTRYPLRIAGTPVSAELGFNQGPSLQYSRASESTTGDSAVQQRSAMVQRTVEGLKKGWTQAPEIVLVDSMQDARMPSVIREADAAQRSQGAEGNVEGVWYGGRVYLLADAMSSEADVTRVLFHEVLGHHGLRGNFGKDLDKVLDQVAKLRSKDVAAKAAEYGLDMSNPDHVRYAAEEVLAELAQSRPDLGLVQRAIAAIRNFLRSHVPDMKSLELTDADIVQGYLLPARGWVERAGHGGTSGEGVLNQGNSNEVRGTFAPSTMTISLLAGADLSTFLHESGHFFLEVQLDMAQRIESESRLFGADTIKPGERELIADAQKLLAWFGVSDLQSWFNMTLEEQRQYHEQFARGFEAYLAEGNAPSVEMQGIFQRFRAWMIAVYKDLKVLNVELTADVRAVMDRMIASTEEIQVAEMGRSMAPLFATPDMAGMTAEGFAAYQKEGVAASQAAIDELQAKGMRDMQWLQNYRLRALRKLNQEAKAQRAELEMEARSQVMSQQVYQAWQFLTGKQAEGGFPAGRISTLELAAMLEMPAEQVELLKARKMTAKDGLHPLMVAERFGYDSAEAMIYDLSQAVPPKEAITQLTDQMMLEQFGELATAEAISRAADQAVHNQVRARMIATELKSITKATGSPREMAAAAKAFATQMIARQRIMDIKPLEYSRAETRAAKAAAKALAAGDTQKSGIEKRNQLLNAQAARQGHDTQDEVKRAVRYLRGLLSGKGKIDPGYRDQIAAMLERFSLTNVSNVATERRQSLASWIEQQRELGIEPDLAPELVTEAFRQNWREMTVEQFRGLVEAIQQIEHLGRLKHKLLAIKDKREFEAVRDAVVASIREHYSGKTPDQYSPATNAETLKLRAHQFFVDHLKVANISQAMDGGETGGEMWGFFVRSAQERANWKATKQADLTEKLMEIMIPVLKRNREMRKREFYPALGMSMTREQVFAIALNLGNEGNISRLLTGGLNGRKVSMQDLVGIVESRLTAEDLQAVQAIWDLMGTLAPEAQAKNKRVYGVEMAMVEPMPLVTKHGTLRGGYYPIVYDPRGTVRNADISEEQAAKEALQSARTAASTRRTYTKTRSSKTPYPLMLSFDGVHRGLTQVVHDLAWHEWSIDTGRMLRDVEFQQAVRETYGKDYLDTIKRWHDDIVLENTREHDAFSKASLVMRSNISVAAMGYSLLTAIQQPIGMTQSAARYGTMRMAKAVAAFTGSPKAKTKEVFELSEFMRNRSRSRYREVSEMKSQVDLSGNKLAEANRSIVQHAFDLMGWVQLSVDIPTWWAGYEQALEQGHDEAKSIAMADQGVIDSQGDGAIQNLSGMQRSKIGKIFTLFYTYLSSALNMIYQTSKSERSLARKAHDVLMLTLIPATLTAFLKWAILPSDDDDDGEEKYWRLVKEIIKENVALPLSMFVGVRELAGVADLAVGETPFSYSGPSGVRVIGDTLRMASQTTKAVMDGEATDATRKAAITFIGSATGLPAAQINRSITGVKALAEGETTNPAAIGFGFKKQ